MAKVFRSRNHSLYFDSDDLCVLVYDGPILADDIVVLHDEMRRQAKDKLRFVLLVDLSRMTTVDPHGRKAAAETLDMPNLKALASFGQSWVGRVTATLTIALIRTLGKVKCPIQSFETESEARAWLERQARDGADGGSPTVPQAPLERAPRP